MAEANSKTDTSGYSPMVQGLHHAFERFKERGDTRYLMVFHDAWYDCTTYKGIKSGQYPWAVHDQFVSSLAPDQRSTKLVLGFDLQRDFEEQMVGMDLEKLEVFDGLLMKPVLWIPDRTGQIPEEKRQAALKEALKPDRPKFTII